MQRILAIWLAGCAFEMFCLIGCAPSAGPPAASAPGRITYVDATDGPMGNTRLATGEVLIGRGSPIIGNDNLWSKRPEGNSGSVFTTNDGRPSGPEDGPGLVTTIMGLAPDERYRVYAYFWTDQHDWQLKASLSEIAPPGDDPAVSFAKTGSPKNYPAALTNASDFDGPPMVAESNRQLLQAELGETAADSNGRIPVWIDDKPNAESSHRTWYDGVGVARVLPAQQLPTLPKRWLWLVLAALAIGAAILYLVVSLVVNRRTGGGESAGTATAGSVER